MFGLWSQSWCQLCIHWVVHNHVPSLQTAQLNAINTLRPRQNGRRFADDTFKRIFLNENIRVSIEISLKFVPKGPINNIPALVQIMAWRRSGDKPLFESMMVSLLTHTCVTRPQWVNETWNTSKQRRNVFAKHTLCSNRQNTCKQKLNTHG